MTVLALSAADYHADRIDDERPSLSASVASILCAKSPLHAWAAHPRLNPDYEPDEDKKYDLGTAVHSMLLQGEDCAVQVDADSWRTKAAQEERDAIRAAGQVPLLVKDWQRARLIVEAARLQLGAVNARPGLLVDGEPERTIVWEEPNGVLCRSRMDWLHDSFNAIDDLKTTSRSANPERFARGTLFNLGYDVKAAFYLRGLRSLTGRDAQFRWITIETTQPYALAVVAPDPGVLRLAEEKVEHAIRRFGECLESGVWPGYSTEVHYAELPSWKTTEWLEHEEVAAA